MKKILVASHGHLASGVKSVAKILLHDDSAITAVDCYVDESDPGEKIRAFIDGVEPQDEALIFTDLLGGSVCNMVTAMRPEQYGIIHVTGFNLAVVLECLISVDCLTPEAIDSIVGTASTLMKRIELLDAPAEESDAEEEDGFFM